MKNFLVKLDPKQLRMLLALSIIVILFAGYRFGFQTFNDKAETIEEENLVLSQRYDELDALVQMEPVYDEDGKKCKDGIEEIKKSFGTVIDKEDSLRFLIDLQNYAKAAIPSIGFSEPEVIFSSTDIPTTNNTGVYVYKTPVNISFTSTYFGFKEVMNFINSHKNKMSVNSVSLSFDSETGNLSGSMEINQYAMLGTDQVYEPPVFNAPNIGTDNIFGSFEYEPVVEKVEKEVVEVFDDQEETDH